MSTSATGTPANAVGVSFADLLAYSDSETKKWKAWFEQNPAALDVKVGEKIGTVRDLVKHIFQAEAFLTGKLVGSDVSKESLEPQDDGQMWAMHQRTFAALQAYLKGATDADLNRPISFSFGGGFSATARKVMTQVVLHGVHHWAQIAMEARQAGIASNGPHDILLSKVMA